MGVGTGECMGKEGIGDAEDGRHREGAVGLGDACRWQTLLPWTTMQRGGV